MNIVHSIVVLQKSSTIHMRRNYFPSHESGNFKPEIFQGNLIGSLENNILHIYLIIYQKKYKFCWKLGFFKFLYVITFLNA
jgi:hypothetical protein